MTEAPEVQIAGIVRTRNNGDVYATSIDVTYSGAFIVDTIGHVCLIPWHNINEVTFLETPLIPARHEGSE